MGLPELRSPEPPQFGRREMEFGMKDRQMGAIRVWLVYAIVYPRKNAKNEDVHASTNLKKWKRDMTGKCIIWLVFSFEHGMIVTEIGT